MDKVFEANPNLSAYHKTSDGEAFFNDSDAKNHAKTLKDKSVKLVEKGAAPAENATVKTTSANDVIAAIEAAETLEALETYKSDTRKSVVAAFEKKTAELKTAE